MEVAVERPPPVKEEKRADTKPAEIIEPIGSALPIVFESFQSPGRTTASSMKQEEHSSRLEAAKAEMGEVREENARLKTMLSRVVSDYQALEMRFLDAVKVREQAAAASKAKLILDAEPAAATPAPPPPPAAADDDLVSLSLGTRSSNGAGRRKGGGHERSSSSSGTAEDSQLSLGLGFSSRPPSTTDDEKASDAGPVLNLSSDDSSSADDTAKRARTESRKSPSGGSGAGDGAADDEVQQQAKKTRVSVRVKCDTPTMNDGCQWRKYGQKISKGNPCPRAYYRCTVAPNCPVRKQVQRCAEDRTILITTYEGTHNHHLPPAATAMASTTSAAAAMLTAGSTTSSSASLSRHHLSLASAGLLGPTTMVSTAASCPTITLDLTAPAGLMHTSSPFAAPGGYETTKALPAAWSSGYPAAAYGGGQLPSSYFAAKSSQAMGHLFAGLQGMSSRPEQLFGGQASSYLQRTASLGGGGGQSAAGMTPVVTDTLAKVITSDPNFQSVLAAVITSYMGRGGGGGGEAAHQK